MNAAWSGRLAIGAMASVQLLCGATTAAVEPSEDATIRAHYFEGIAPAPRDENGRFRNPGRPIVQAGPSVTLPFFGRRVAARFRTPIGLPRTVAVDIQPPGSTEAPRATWLGHATVLVQTSGVAFLTDPNWSQTAGPTRFTGAVRLVDPPIALDDLPPIDFVLLSHNHYDHMDLPTLRRLADRNPELVLFAPLGHTDLLESVGAARIVELDWGEWVTFAGVRVHCLPARHWSRRGLFDMKRSLWSSWAVTGDQRSFFFAGDTAAFDGLGAIGRALGPFDLAALPIGAYEPVAMMKDSHLNPEEAAAASRELRASRALAIHYGTFDLSDEPHDEPPRRFRAAMAAMGAAPETVWVLGIGESRSF
jgi:N-acyl-phosphatidylethanolamine-hydrolysing phospholipase D